MEEQILCISYFDQIIGPNIFYCSEPQIEKAEYPDLGRILEFNDEEGSFIFAFRKYQTLNYLFYIDSKVARGGKELVMITYMIKAAFFRNEIVDVFKYLESKTPLLEEYILELRKLNEFSSVLHASKKDLAQNRILTIGSEDFQREFLLLMDKYLKKLSPTYEIEKPLATKLSMKKVFIFGPRLAGKTTYLKNLESVQFHNQTNRDLPTRIIEIILENLEILTFDCIERELECDRCKNFGGCVENAQGYIVIFDLSTKESLFEATDKLQKIINRCNDLGNQTTPILIIGNKINNVALIEPDTIYKQFDIKELRNCGMKIKYYPINVLTEDEQNMNALHWLVKEML